MKKLLLMLVLLLMGGAANAGLFDGPSDDDRIAETWRYARDHREYTIPDSGLEEVVDDATARCTALNVRPPPAGYKTVACTVFLPGGPAFSIVSRDASRIVREHEKSHRVHGQWHEGYSYSTENEIIGKTTWREPK